jgi:hypothetical protein
LALRRGQPSIRAMFSRGSRRLIEAVLLLVFLTLAVSAQALTDAEKAGARAAAEQGGLAYQDGRFAEAVDYFTRAEEIVHATPHLLYIARASAQLGRLIAAREAYLKIVQEEVAPRGPRIFVETKAQAESELAELEPRIPSVSIVVEGAGKEPFEVLRDDVVLPAVLVGIPQPLDPGEHTFSAKAKNMASDVQKVTVREGAQQTVVLKLQPVAGAEVATTTAGEDVVSESKGKPGLKIAGYSAIGLGVVGVVLGTVFVLQSGDSFAAADRIYDGCPQNADDMAVCSSADRTEIDRLDSQGQTQGIIGGVGFAVGGVALATGVVLLVMGSKGKKASPASAYVEPIVGFGTLGLRGAF